MKTFIRNISLVVGLLVASVWFSSCEEVLDVKPKGQLAEGVSTGETVDKILIAAYQGLGAHFFGNDPSFAGPSTNWIIDVMSDDAYKGGGGIGDRTDIHALETFTLDPTTIACFYKWQNNMFAIARANLAIREINALEDPLYPKSVRLGEAIFLRAHFHFDLFQNFNQIPYLFEETDPTSASNTQYTQDEIWDFIEADFEAAFNGLPAQQDEIGRINKYAAAAYLAKCALRRGNWSEVLTWVTEVKKGPFELLDEFENLATIEFENGSESVFTAQFSTANIFANHNWSNLLNVTLGPGIDNGAYANGDDFYLASQNLVNAYRTDENGLPLFDTFNEQDVTSGNFTGNLDPRVDFSFGRLGIPWKGTASYSESWVRSPDYFPGFSSKKHVVAPDDPQVHNGFPWAASGLNFNFIRYAEVLLWEAEALIESGGNLDEARALINDIRNRAMNSTYVKTLDGSQDAANYNIGLYPSAGWTQDLARKAVRFERRLELALEGHRFYDLRRWGNMATRINDYIVNERDNVPYLNDVSFEAGKHEYLPLPQREIDLGPSIYTQNPNY
ncbi:MAG: RagB/SusD family nutrient uptake outer membrane protein [Bacteroidia bacterium]|nr:RagB/SusD family nutrient uptake outer membrane protein [Bacteroidia bacterium]